MSDVVVPEVGEVGMEVTFVGWLRAAGDHVLVGEPIFEVDTGKVILEVEAYVEGVLVDLKARPGDVVTPRQVVAQILGPSEANPYGDTDVGAPPSSSAPTLVPPTPSEAPGPSEPGYGVGVQAPGVATPASVGKPASVAASPRARRRAAEAGLDLASITGSGPNGMISERDVEAAITSGDGGSR